MSEAHERLTILEMEHALVLERLGKLEEGMRTLGAGVRDLSEGLRDVRQDVLGVRQDVLGLREETRYGNDRLERILTEVVRHLGLQPPGKAEP